MHKSTVMLKGTFQNGRTRVQVRGGHIPNVTTEGSCFSIAMEQVPHLLGKRVVEVRETLCFPEFRSTSIASRLDSWTRKGMTFFVWRSQNENVLTFLMLNISTDFEVDEVLEELLDLTVSVPTLGNCTGRKEGLVSYDIVRVAKDAFEVMVLHDGHSTPYVGYVGSGSSLSEAIYGVLRITKNVSF